MAVITLNPNVPNFFVDLDWRDSTKDPVGFARELVALYEAGKVILLKNAPFRINFDLLNRVDFPRGRKYQKLREDFFLYPKLHRSDVRRVLLAAFGANIGLYLAFRREVNRVSEELRRFAKDVFSGYRFLKWDVSWRFTPTGPEGLHVDYIRHTEDLHFVRVFVNVDRAARIWTLSHQVEDLIHRFYERAGLAELRGPSPSNIVCRRLNEAVFDPIKGLPRSAMDRHVVEFQQGDVWLCESRINSHEIFSGHRMVATHFHVDPRSMLDPSLRVDARVAAALDARAAVVGHRETGS